MSSVQQARKLEKRKHKEKLKRIRKEKAEEQLKKLLEETDYDELKGELTRLNEVPFLDPHQKKRKNRLEEDMAKIEQFRAEKEEAEKALEEGGDKDEEPSSDSDLDHSLESTTKVTIDTGSSWAGVLGLGASSFQQQPRALPPTLTSSSGGEVPQAQSAPTARVPALGAPTGSAAVATTTSLAPMVLHRRAAQRKRGRDDSDAGTSAAQQQQTVPSTATTTAPKAKPSVSTSDRDAADMEALLASIAEDSD